MFRRFLFFSILFLYVSCPAFSQDSPQRDPQAVAILNQTLAATGWAALPADAAANGTVTRIEGETRESFGVTLKAAGPGKLRVETRAADGPVTVVRNGLVATHEKTGRAEEVPAHAVASLSPHFFPFFAAFASLGSDKELLYRGIEQVNGEDAHRIEIRLLPDPERPNSQLDRTRNFAFLISTRTFLPLKVEFKRLAADNPNFILSCEKYFSDFRLVDRVLVPFYQEDFVFGRKTTELRLASVQVNVGLSDADFLLVAAATEPE